MGENERFGQFMALMEGNKKKLSSGFHCKVV
jgi:hypothetical protein